MGFGQAIATCFRNYVTFSGRAGRAEYWWFVLFLILGGIVASIFDTLLFGASAAPVPAAPETGDPDAVAVVVTYGNGPLSGLFDLVTFLPALAAGWRRLHDTGRSGFWLLLPLVAVVAGSFVIVPTVLATGMTGASDPEVGAVIAVLFSLLLFALLVSFLLVLWWLTRPSQPGANQYGPPPAPS